MTIEDRRVRRTRHRLQDALTSLIVEKGYDKTTVQDLIDRADVGRSTFYAHYETKDHLLLSTVDILISDMERHLTDEPGRSEAILPSLGVFRHIAESHRQYRALIGSRGIGLVRKAVLDAFADRARSNIARRAPGAKEDPVPADARAAFVAGSLLAFVDWWLDNDMPYPPETMADMFRELTAA